MRFEPVLRFRYPTYYSMTTSLWPTEAQVATMRDVHIEAALRRIMPDLYFINASGAQRRSHLQLLARLSGEQLILDFQERPGTPLTELTICAYDDAEPGLLSKVCGTLAALRLNIQTAFIYTVQSPAANPSDDSESAPPHRWVVLDTLLLSEPYRGRTRALSRGTVQSVSDELTRILQGEVTVTQLLTQMHRRPYPPLHVHDIVATPGHPTGLTLRAEDHPGVLYRTTVGLASLGLNIQVAQINTNLGIVDDIFFVTGVNGEPLSATATQEIAPQLRAMLQSSNAPVEP